MKLDSKIFDRIRVRGTAKEEVRAPECAWHDCCEPGTHRAPRGRNQEGQYYQFCFEHVRLYNKSYNYFSGLDDESIQAFIKSSLTGHLPTWGMGSNGSGETGASSASSSAKARPRWNKHTHANRPQGTVTGPSRKPRTLEMKAMDTLGVPHNTGPEVLRLRYKALVKQYHPDANGGDRTTEDRLREVIQAYKLLKQAGFC
ncbi:J domain-containing protein [Aureimonas fodinaquatilis]|uniref:J domain-containing protein n=1 Tax=Aureimonas fodinaquatilis TaxID=2565783 RepID=A0A5B0DYL8_9HYPH|nr:J domain-containing protein [Aureimonas fodinaquatilis]KAA0971603.1 J domain-containing protein [Aureimonas fodinaquatilis]